MQCNVNPSLDLGMEGEKLYKTFLTQLLKLHMDWGLHDFWGLGNCVIYDNNIVSIEENVTFFKIQA